MVEIQIELEPLLIPACFLWDDSCLRLLPNADDYKWYILCEHDSIRLKKAKSGGRLASFQFEATINRKATLPRTACFHGQVDIGEANPRFAELKHGGYGFFDSFGKYLYKGTVSQLARYCGVGFEHVNCFDVLYVGKGFGDGGGDGAIERLTGGHDSLAKLLAYTQERHKVLEVVLLRMGDASLTALEDGCSPGFDIGKIQRCFSSNDFIEFVERMLIRKFLPKANGRVYGSFPNSGKVPDRVFDAAIDQVLLKVDFSQVPQIPPPNQPTVLQLLNCAETTVL